MTPDPRLNFLVDLREAAGLTQKEVARRFDLAERQGYKSVAAWEKGESIPKARLRARFLRYLWDDLRLHKEPTRFAECWDILVDCWHWDPLREAERADLRLPPKQTAHSVAAAPMTTTTIDGTVIGGNVATGGGDMVHGDQYNYIFQFSQLYRQANDTLDAVQLATQITEYLNWLEDSTRTIELRGISARDTRVSLPLEHVFVPLHAELTTRRRQGEPHIITLDQLLTVGDRLAVIGGPGSGKSTVLQYIAWALSMALLHNDNTWVEQKLGLRLYNANSVPPLPLYLPLSAYARLRFHGNGQDSEEVTFPEFIQRYLRQSHCNITELPPDFFARLLKNGHSVILLLDGLDEVSNEKQRSIVTQTIENLVAGRKGIRVVVTCRSIAYKGQTILARDFQQITVQPLDNQHIEQLVRCAYKAVYSTNQGEQTARTEELLVGINQLEDAHARRLGSIEHRLINSPLLVRMLLIVHLNDRKLPQRRVDLYRRCVDTILNSEHVQDRAVAYELSTLRGNNLSLMSYLAFAMHQQGEEQGREVDLYTLQELLKPDYVAESDAFLHLTHLRGTMVAESNGYYRFLHLAFQEYLAARFLAEVYWRDKGMKFTMHFIAEQAPNSWWREVITLLPGYLSEASPPLAKRILYALAGQRDGVTDWQHETDQWSPDVQLSSVEIATTSALEWFPEDTILRQQLAQRILHFFKNPSLLNQVQPRLRALAGRALAALGDPRFRSDFWFLPDDRMLGFVEIPEGKFTMGSDKHKDKEARDNEIPEHEVDLPTFYIARYPVTVNQFRVFLEAINEQPIHDACMTDTDNCPVRFVTWFEATRYCQWLTETLRASDKTPVILATKLAAGWQFMLPSEAEWEKAARNNKARYYPWGDEPVEPNRANYNATGIGTTSAVGCFPAGATPEGITDLTGNVWEWTKSLYQRYPYPSNEQARSERERVRTDDIKITDKFVVRGGSYNENVSYMRASRSDDYFPNYGNNICGFRVVFGAPPNS